MNVLGAIAFPHSLGLYYSAITQYLGFLEFGDEYKVMGLGAYGEPEFLERIREIVHSKRCRNFGWHCNTSRITARDRK